MPVTPLIFDDFAPDKDPLSQGACQPEMNGMYPVVKGYRTLPNLLLAGTGLGNKAYGAAAGLLNDFPVSVAGTINAIFVNINGVYVDSGIGVDTEGNRWRFAIQGNTMIAVDGVDVPLQYFPAAPGFTPLDGNPPVASIVETTDYATILVEPYSQNLWSNLSPNAPWIPSVPAQVYLYNLGQIPGDITAAHRLRSLLVVYRQNAFQCATFVGVDIGWDFGSPGTISLDIGAAGNECVINTGDYHLIWGPDDFWQFDGYNLNRIPNNLKEWAFRDLDQSNFLKVAGRYDVNRNLAFWHYPSVNAQPAGQLDSYIVLNLRTGKWGQGRLNVDVPLIGLMNDAALIPDSGIILSADQNLYLYDEAAPWTPNFHSYITSNDFGDRHSIYTTRRVRPGFTLYPTPVTANPLNPAAPIGKVSTLTPLVQMPNTGVPPVAVLTTPLSSDGWFNFKTSARLTRYRMDFYSPAEITQSDVDINPTGSV